TVLATAWCFISSGGNELRRKHALSGLGLALCLVAYCPYEALYNLTIPCLYLFTWIGACLGRNQESKSAARAEEPAIGRVVTSLRPSQNGPERGFDALQQGRALRLNALANR